MKKFIKKITYAIFTTFIAISTIFFIIRLVPGDPVSKILGPEASLDDILKYKQQLGLHLPILHQYFVYIKNLMLMDLGVSLFKKKDIIQLILKHMQPTLLLASIAVFFSTPLGVAFGIISAINKSNIKDNFFRVISLLALAFPIFSLAPILVLIFSIKFQLFPVSEWGSLKHLFLPVLTLIIPLSSIIMRVSRNKFLEEEHAPWVTVLEAKGLNKLQVILRITKICLPTILNIVAIQLSVVLAGAMVTETIFDIPGMGTLLFESIQNRDYPIVQGIIIYTTFIYMLVYFIIDYINSIIDPRIEY